MRQRVLLTGASGAVGFEAFKELLRRRKNYSIRILCLDNDHERKLFHPFVEKIEIQWGDLRDEETVQQAVSGVDAVIHTAAVIPPLADHNPELAWQVNVSGTQNMVDALSEHDTAPKFVYTSSVSVYGDRVKNPHIRVGDELSPSVGDEYAKTKIEAEQRIQSSKLQWSIMRLCGILANRLKIQPLMFHMPLETSLEWCHAADAGYALVQSLECERIIGRIFNLGGGESCRIKARNFLQEMFPLFGLDNSVIPEHAFATQNFHTGDYIDGDELEHLLRFRRRSLDDFFKSFRERISPAQQFMLGLIPKKIVRSYLMNLSEPLKAIRKNDVGLIQRYYGSLDAYQGLLSALLS